MAARRIPAWVSRKYWDRLFSKIPAPPLAEWRVPTIPQAAPKAVPGPKHRPTAPVHHTTEGTSPMTYPLQALEEAGSQLASYHSQSATEMANFLAGWSPAFLSLSASIRALADNMQDNMPFGVATPEAVRDLAAGVVGLATVAEGLHVTFRQEHAEKLTRLETPAADEKQWDLGAQ